FVRPSRRFEIRQASQSFWSEAPLRAPTQARPTEPSGDKSPQIAHNLRPTDGTERGSRRPQLTSSLRVSAPFRRPPRQREIMRGVDHTDMRISLREVAERAASPRVELLRQQPHVVAEREQPLEQSERLVAPAREGEDIRKPE